MKIKCHYCGQKFLFGELTKDHVVPRSLGGRDIIENVVASCTDCNNSKGNDMPTCECKFCTNAVKMFEQQLAGIPVVRRMQWMTSV